MKKIISLILAISCILCLASCSRGSEGKGDGLEVSIGSARIEKNILDEVVIIIRTHVNNTSDEEKDMIWLKDSATQAGKELRKASSRRKFYGGICVCSQRKGCQGKVHHYFPGIRFKS